MQASAFDTLLHNLREEHRREISTLHYELDRLKNYKSPSSGGVRESVASQQTNSCPGLSTQLSSEPDSSLALAVSAKAEPKPVLPINRRSDSLKLNSSWYYPSSMKAPMSPVASLRRQKKFQSLASDSGMLKHHVGEQLLAKQSSHLIQRGLSKLEKYSALRGWHPHQLQGEKPGPIARMINHQAFDSVSACAIIANTVLIGSITSYTASTYGLSELPLIYVVMNRVFTCWFLLEVVLRWIADGLVGFFFGPHGAWNVFDFIVVGTDLMETFLGMLTTNDNSSLGNLTVMRMLRVLRIARALRIVRLVHFCKELRMMVLSILRSGMALLWSMVLLGIIIYIFSIFLMQATAQHMAEKVTQIREHGSFTGFEAGSSEAYLEHHLGTLSMSCYVLFQAVSGGISWSEIGDPLNDIHWSNALVFCFFVFFTIFAMLNIITGIFVETAIDAVQNDRDEVIHEEMNSDNSLIKQLHQIFNEADEEQQGKISEGQFEKLLSSKRTYATLSAMGLRVSEARGMFALLDPEHQGYVSIEDFLVGCMRLRGGAKSVDLITLLYENRTMMDMYARFTRYVEGEMKARNAFEDRVDHNLFTLMNTMWKNGLLEQQSSFSQSEPQEKETEVQAGSADVKGANSFALAPNDPCVELQTQSL